MNTLEIELVKSKQQLGEAMNQINDFELGFAAGAGKKKWGKGYNLNKNKYEIRLKVKRNGPSLNSADKATSPVQQPESLEGDKSLQCFYFRRRTPFQRVRKKIPNEAVPELASVLLWTPLESPQLTLR